MAAGVWNGAEVGPLNASTFTVGFRVEGPPDGPRRRTHYETAADAYRTCDPRAVNGTEAYISHFRFNDAMADYLATHGSTKGFAGHTWASGIAFDIDRETIDAALADTRTLLNSLESVHGVPPECLLVYFSGRKGFHIETPTRLWEPPPSAAFHRISREFASQIAVGAGVTIDTGVYDAVRLLRPPNSRHPKTRLFKRWLPADKLIALTAEDCMALAEKPCPFDWPIVEGSPHMLTAVWDAAAAAVAAQDEAVAQRRADIAAGKATAKVNNLTRRLLAGDPVEEGQRHKRIYSAAANLAELGVPLHAVHELLTEAGRDSGLPPRDVFRAIENGHARGGAAC
jgi:hypothetical protein